MHSHLSEIFSGLEAIRLELLAAIDATPAAQRAVRPGEGRWSVDEVVEHLALTERRFTGFMVAALERAGDQVSAGADMPPRTPLPERVAILMRDRIAHRRVAPDAVQPTGRLDTAAARTQLDAARQALQTTLLAADGRALGIATHEHPVMGVLDVYQLAELVGRHEARHTEQIREIAAALREQAVTTP